MVARSPGNPGRYRVTERQGRGDDAPDEGTDGARPGEETRSMVAYDTETQQHVLLTRVPLPEVVSGTLLDEPDTAVPGPSGSGRRDRGEQRHADPPGRGEGGTAGADAALHAARAAAEPEHRNLVPVLDVQLHSGAIRIVTEHDPEAVPLGHVLREQGPLTLYRAAEVLSDLLAAVRATHRAGRTHRNITERTVLLCADGTALLGGAAEGAAQEALCGEGGVPSVVDVDNAGGTNTGAAPHPAETSAPDVADTAASGASGDAADAVDTIQAMFDQAAVGGVLRDAPGPHWGVVELRHRDARMAEVGACAERWAPEQVGPRVVDGVPERTGPWLLLPPRAGPATDLWALGVLLFRMVHGRAPYPEEDPEALLRAVRRGPDWSGPRAWTQQGRRREPLGVLRSTVAELLATVPANRPDPRELRLRLDVAIARAPQPETAEPPDEPDRLPVLRPPGTVRTRPSPGQVQHGRHARDGSVRGGRRRGLWQGAALVLLVLALVAGALLAAVALFSEPDGAHDSTTAREATAACAVWTADGPRVGDNRMVVGGGWWHA